jgi:hypothetical protein
MPDLCHEAEGRFRDQLPPLLVWVLFRKVQNKEILLQQQDFSFMVIA